MEGRKEFVVDDLSKAEWAMKKIAQQQKIVEEKQEQALKMKADIDEWLKKETKEQTDSINYFTSLLQPFATEQLKDNKKKSIKLPSGSVGYRSSQPSWSFNGQPIDKNNLEFVDYVSATSPAFVKTKKSVDWSSFKKTLTNNKGMILSSEGEILDKIQIREEPPKFYVKVKGE